MRVLQSKYHHAACVTRAHTHMYMYKYATTTKAIIGRHDIANISQSTKINPIRTPQQCYYITNWVKFIRPYPFIPGRTHTHPPC